MIQALVSIVYHIRICQVLPQCSWGDTWQIQTCFKTSKLYCSEVKIFFNRKINLWSFNNLHPCALGVILDLYLHENKILWETFFRYWPSVWGSWHSCFAFCVNIGASHLLIISGVTILVLCNVAKFLLLIWRCNLCVPHLQTSFIYLMKRQGTGIVVLGPDSI